MPNQDLAIFGYLAVAGIAVAFFIYPRYGLLAAFLFKPVIDMFWWVKSTTGFLPIFSPLYIAGVGVPILALLAKSRVHAFKRRNGLDLIVLAYLLIFGFLTVLKSLSQPEYLYNSIDTYARFGLVALFYFIGKHYFQNPQSRRLFSIVIVASAFAPFFLTIFQGVSGQNLQVFSDVVKGSASVDTGAVSAYYLEGRRGLVRISGVYEGVYELAFWGVISSILIYCFVVSKDFTTKIWHYAIMLAAVYMVYFTYSRSAWVVFGLTFFFVFLLRREFGKLVLFLSFLILLYMLVPTVQYRFEDELGFFLGTRSFDQFGYSRGRLWLIILEKFSSLPLSKRIIGTHGLGNPENEFLGYLLWFGYIGIATAVTFKVLITAKLVGFIRGLSGLNNFDANALKAMAIFIVVTHWFAGQGNQFSAMISVQWIIWTWVGITSSASAEYSALRRRRALWSGDGLHHQSKE